MCDLRCETAKNEKGFTDKKMSYLCRRFYALRIRIILSNKKIYKMRNNEKQYKFLIKNDLR